MDRSTREGWVSNHSLHGLPWGCPGAPLPLAESGRQHTHMDTHVHPHAEDNSAPPNPAALQQVHHGDQPQPWCHSLVSGLRAGGEGWPWCKAHGCRESSMHGMLSLGSQTSGMLLPPSIKKMLTTWKMANQLSSLFYCQSVWSWKGNGLCSCAGGTSPSSPGLGWCHLKGMAAGGLCAQGTQQLLVFALGHHRTSWHN